MSDQELGALLRRVEREIAREISTGVDNPVVAELRKMRREISRECGHDLKKYDRYMKEQAQAFRREMALHKQEEAAPRSPAAQAEPAKMSAQKGGKGA